jgi:hypothetical protein
MNEKEEKKKIVRELRKKAGIKDENYHKTENPFKKLHYSTEHLPYFHQFSCLANLYGRHYIPILKARYYQLIGGIIQRNIKFGSLFTDTRLHVAYPIVTEGGKNELIYSIKELIKRGIEKKEGKIFTMSEPSSLHPEQLIGKFIEVKEKILNESTGRYKTITKRIENRGHLNNDFLDFDECTSLITSNSKDDQQAREHLSKSENPLGRNEVEKRLTEDTPENTVRYYPNCTNSYYFQPFKKIPEEVFLQGFLRRKLIPIGSINSFLNLPDDRMYEEKIQQINFNREEYISTLINHLEGIRDFANKGLDIVFDNEATELIKQYALYISGQAQLHSEKITNYFKISKYTTLGYLVKMSVIIAISYGQQVVNKNAVSLAFMDLVELMQNTFDFIYNGTWGDFSYGTSWKGADKNQKECLKILYQKKAFNKEESKITIDSFVDVVSQVYGVGRDQGRNKYLEMKKIGLIDSGQVGQYGSSVWLNFNPKEYKEHLEGDKGLKGFDIYNYVFQHQNTIVGALKSFQPFQVSSQKAGGSL